VKNTTRTLQNCIIGKLEKSALSNHYLKYNFIKLSCEQRLMLKYLQRMVGHSGTLINGVPIVCGGYNGDDYDVKCFQYQRYTKRWERVTFFLVINIHKLLFAILDVLGTYYRV